MFARLGGKTTPFFLKMVCFQAIYEKLLNIVSLDGCSVTTQLAMISLDIQSSQQLMNILAINWISYTLDFLGCG